MNGVYYFAKLTKMSNGSVSEGYFQEVPVVGDSFILHCSIEQGKDIVVPRVVSVHEYGASSLKFPSGSKRGDFIMETASDYYLVQLYHMKIQD